MIKPLKRAVNNNIAFLARYIQRVNDHDHREVHNFQDAVVKDMNQYTNSSNWQKEVRLLKGQKDSIDILGQDSYGLEWIIEIDAQRADQVAKKALSRIAVKSANGKPIHYVAILYPRKQFNNKTECIKYLKYAKLFCDTFQKNVTIHAIVIDYIKPDDVDSYKITYYSIDSDGIDIDNRADPDQINTSENNTRVKYVLIYTDKNGVSVKSPKFGMNRALIYSVRTLMNLDPALANSLYSRIRSKFSTSIISSDEHEGKVWYDPILGTDWLAHTGMWKTTDNSFKTLKDLVKEIGEPYNMEIVKC